MKGKPYAQKKAAVGDDRYVLSLKDLCTLDILPDITDLASTPKKSRDA